MCDLVIESLLTFHLEVIAGAFLVNIVCDYIDKRLNECTFESRELYNVHIIVLVRPFISKVNKTLDLCRSQFLHNGLRANCYSGNNITERK